MYYGLGTVAHTGANDVTRARLASGHLTDATASGERTSWPSY